MAADIKLTVGADTKPMVRDVNQALNVLQRTSNLKLKSKGFTQPLGRITGQVEEFGKSLDASNARVLAFAASAGAMAALSRAFSDLLRVTVQVEKSLKDIEVIFDGTASQFKQFSSDIFNVGKTTGQSFQQIASAATEITRQGLGAQETLTRMTDAMILARQSGMEAGAAVSGLTAAVNSFADAGATSTQIVNKLANVDAAFAVSTEDLIEGLKRSGATAQQAGVSLDELIGVITSLQQTTARGGAVIGNSLKSIFVRTQRPETLRFLEQIGVGVRDLEGKTRPTLQILGDLSRGFEKLTDAQKSNIGQTVAGVFQVNAFNALMKDLAKSNSIASQATLKSANSTDEAIKRNKELNETLSAQLNAAKLAITEVSAAFGKSVIGPTLQNIAKVVESVTGALQKAKETTAGVLGGKFLESLGEVLGGPGLVIASVAIGRFFSSFARFGGQALKFMSEYVRKTEEQRLKEQQVQNLLSQRPDLLKRMNSGARGQLQVQREILQILEAQALLTKQITAASGSIALAGRKGAKGRRLSTKGTVSNANGIPQVGRNLNDAIRREVAAGVPRSTIRVHNNSRFATSGNPAGFVVTNTRDEPNGLKSIPNFANKGIGKVYKPAEKILDPTEAAIRIAIAKLVKKGGLLMNPQNASVQQAKDAAISKRLQGLQERKYSEIIREFKPAKVKGLDLTPSEKLSSNKNFIDNLRAGRKFIDKDLEKKAAYDKILSQKPPAPFENIMGRVTDRFSNLKSKLTSSKGGQFFKKSAEKLSGKTKNFKGLKGLARNPALFLALPALESIIPDSVTGDAFKTAIEGVSTGTILSGGNPLGGLALGAGFIGKKIFDNKKQIAKDEEEIAKNKRLAKIERERFEQLLKERKEQENINIILEDRSRQIAKAKVGSFKSDLFFKAADAQFAGLTSRFKRVEAGRAARRKIGSEIASIGLFGLDKIKAQTAFEESEIGKSRIFEGQMAERKKVGSLQKADMQLKRAFEIFSEKFGDIKTVRNISRKQTREQALEEIEKTIELSKGLALEESDIAALKEIRDAYKKAMENSTDALVEYDQTIFNLNVEERESLETLKARNAKEEALFRESFIVRKQAIEIERKRASAIQSQLASFAQVDFTANKITGAQLGASQLSALQASVALRGVQKGDFGRGFKSATNTAFSYNTASLLFETTSAVTELGVALKDNLRGALTDSILGAKSAADAFRNLGDALLRGALDKSLGMLINAGFGAVASKFATGGVVTGGSGARDDVPAMLTKGEFVLKKSAVDRIGISTLNSINTGNVRGFANGGATASLANRVDYMGDPKRPTGMRFNIDPSLSAAGLTSSINRQNQIRQERASAFFSYRQSVQEAMEREDRIRRGRLLGAVINAAAVFGAGAIAGGFGPGTVGVAGDSEIGSSFVGGSGSPIMPAGGAGEGFASGGSVSRSTPALLTGGEARVSGGSTALLGAINRGSVSRFADGSSVGGLVGGGQMNNEININVNIENSTGSSSIDSESNLNSEDQESIQKFSENLTNRIKDVVLEEMHEQSRPGGIIDAKVKAG